MLNGWLYFLLEFSIFFKWKIHPIKSNQSGYIQNIEIQQKKVFSWLKKISILIYQLFKKKNVKGGKIGFFWFLCKMKATKKFFPWEKMLPNTHTHSDIQIRKMKTSIWNGIKDLLDCCLGSRTNFFFGTKKQFKYITLSVSPFEWTEKTYWMLICIAFSLSLL